MAASGIRVSTAGIPTNSAVADLEPNVDVGSSRRLASASPGRRSRQQAGGEQPEMTTSAFSGRSRQALAHIAAGEAIRSSRHG